MCVQNLKFVALLVPEIIGDTSKYWAVPGYAHAPFSPIFSNAFVRMDTVNVGYRPNLKSAALPVPEIIGGTSIRYYSISYSKL